MTDDPITQSAAKAWFDRVQAQRLDAGRYRPDGQRWRWDNLTEHDQRGYLALVQPVVDAVTPLIEQRAKAEHCPNCHGEMS